MLRPEESAALQMGSGPVVAIGDDGRIAYASVAALELLGWDHNLVGQTMNALVPERLRARHHEAFVSFVESRHPTLGYPKVQPALGQDGVERPIQVEVIAFRRPDTSIFLCSALAPDGIEPPSLGAIAQGLEDKGYERITR